MEEILLEKPGKKIILLGNEAICRGAIEAGVDFVSTYPGTPASEIGNTFWRIQKELKKLNPNFHFEFSTNEKVAMEAAAGAAFSGAKSLVAFKHFGLNVASDFLMTMVYSGVKGAMVIFVADDPSGWSSAQSEQDTRYYANMVHIPVLEPSDPQECKDFTKFAFKLSEKFKIPVMIRTTTRVSHQSAPVKLGKIHNSQLTIYKFIKDSHQFSTMPPRVLEMKKELLEKIRQIQKFSEKSNLNKIYFNKNFPKLGIICSGISFLYTMEALKKLNLNLPVLKIDLIHPLPENKIKDFLKKLKKVLIIEELEPYLEREIKILIANSDLKVKIYGKEKEKIEGGRIWRERKAILPQVGELKPEYVLLAIAKFSGKKLKLNFKKYLEKFEKVKIPSRPPIFCPGCPYWFIFSAIKKVVDLRNVIFGGEIGCYMMAGHPVLNLQDYLYCMGSANGIAHGISKTTKQKIITFVGDSSFFHAGIPALINTVFNRSNPLVIIFDNQTTAMTGHQPHPGVGKKPEEDGVEPIKIEEIVRACGVKNLRVIDQVTQQEEFQKTLKEFLEKDEVSVIVARHICKLLEKKHAK